MGSFDKDRRGDGVAGDPATAEDRETFSRAQHLLDQMRVPVLLDSRDPHQRLYVAALDGTGNSMVNDVPEKWSVVARTFEQIALLEKEPGLRNISGGYVEGTFTQEGLLRIPLKLIDGRFGHSYGERVETAYYQLCVQAKNWRDEDPHAQIRVVGVGFSRGAEQTATLLRLIDERGIRNPEGATVRFDRDGLVQHIIYADKPLLAPPRQTLQAALLYDPVATGVMDEERRLPASTLSTFQITATRERRDMFPVTRHADPGLSNDNRDLNAEVNTSHSGAGNTYQLNGLGVMSFNLGVDFLNRLSDQPFLSKQALPENEAHYVIHRSEQHLGGLYGTRQYERNGVRSHVDDLSPLPGVQRRDPIDPVLDALVERRTAAPQVPPSVQAMPLYRQSLAALQELGPDVAGYRSQREMEHMAVSVAAQARIDGLQRVDGMVTVKAGTALAAFEEIQDTGVRLRSVSDRQQAVDRPLDQGIEELVRDMAVQDRETQRMHEQVRSPVLH
jgi:hypothetical protein